ncbi:hypothetical protein [Brevibacillus reuszeri]|uniref:hypothetical protein n=1 Tax=Brevibacillus reuszeri TaxID=54915 RepID=UPI00289C0484|nr:hypothetical protein [Brevibacillus reuszeri]
MRDVSNRHSGLPPRSPEMLYNVIRKFYRGAVSHYDLIQEKKSDIRAAWERSLTTKDDSELRQALHTLFLEFHFYVTCWLQIELALYRLAKQDAAQAVVLAKFQSILERHVAVREQLDQTEACVNQQAVDGEVAWSCVEQDAYWFDGISFTVDQASLNSLHQLFQAIQAAKNEHPLK